MANHFYQIGAVGLIDDTLQWDTSSFFVTLVDAGYTYNVLDEDYTDVSGDELAGVTPQAMTGNVVGPTGIANSNSVTFTGVTAPQTLKAIIVYADIGGGVLPLVAYFDTGPGLGLTTTGAPITIDWNGTATTGTVFTLSYS